MLENISNNCRNFQKIMTEIILKRCYWFECGLFSVKMNLMGLQQEYLVIMFHLQPNHELLFVIVIIIWYFQVDRILVVTNKITQTVARSKSLKHSLAIFSIETKHVLEATAAHPLSTKFSSGDNCFPRRGILDLT